VILWITLVVGATLCVACAPGATSARNLHKARHADAWDSRYPLTPSSPENFRLPVFHRIVFVVHADGDYAWHDAEGAGHDAGQEALRQAMETGARDSSGEVFIFHQKRDGVFYAWRAGRLLQRTGYRRTPRDFEAEANVLNAFEARSREVSPISWPLPSVFVYFGHEIPLSPRTHYSASRPGSVFSAQDFSRGVARLEEGSSRSSFGLIILSACYGGNPLLLRALLPANGSDRYVVASPAYLHLSYLDVSALKVTSAASPTLSNPYGSTLNVAALADSIARQSFHALEGRTQTEITVGVYDLRKARAFLESFPARAQGSQWKDCAQDSSFDAAAAAQGTTLYYRPPRFGPAAATPTRSAWQCLF